MDNINDQIKRNLKKFLAQILIIQMLGLILVTSIFVYSEYETKSLMAKQIGQIVEGRIKNGDKRGALYVLSSAKFENFKAIGYFDKNGKRILTFPARLDPDYFKKRANLEKLLDSNVKIELFFDEKSTKRMGTLILVFNIYNSFLKGCLVWAAILILTIPFIRRYRFLIVDNIEKEMSFREAKFTEKVSRQVRHDLAGAMQQIFDITEKDGVADTEKKSLISAVSRIEKTLQDLPGNKAILGKTTKGIERVHNIAYILKSFHDQIAPIIKDKHDINLELKLDSIDLFSHLQSNDLFRSIQNLVENAVGAGAKSIIVSLINNNENELKVSVKNNGNAIPLEIQDKIVESGFTYGKKDGTGIGLSFVQDKVKSWGGALTFSSTEKETEFLLSLKREDVPVYHPISKDLKSFSKLILVDDDSNIHEKLHKFIKSKSILSFFNDYEFEAFLTGGADDNFFAFVDYELGENSKNGLNLIMENDLTEKSFLLTANYDEDKLIQSCSENDIKIIPKNLLNYIVES